MRSRPEPREIPDALPYPWFVVDLPDVGEHHFRALSPIAAMRLGVALSGGAGKLAADDTLGLSIENMRQFCTTIGLCWAHRTLDLETERDDYPSLLDYGEAVGEELNSAGYDIHAVTTLAIRVMASMSGVRTTRAEVAERVGFTPPLEGGPSS